MGHTRRMTGGGGHTRRMTGRLLAERLFAPSGAGHDSAVFENAGVPSAMVFVRNAHGSHNPDEAMDIDDFMLGAEVPRRSLAALAD